MDILFSPIRLNELELLIEKSVLKVLQKPLPPPPLQVEERFLDVKQTAQLFGVSTVTIWSWERANLIQSFRLGNLKRFKYSLLLQSPKLIQRNPKK